MKVLMVGMDGVQLDTFRRGWTPFLESLIDRGQSLAIKEDIVSRGWVEIFTGRHGTETGALYERPQLDGSYRWTDKCSLEGIPGLGESIKPIWQVLNERGYCVGVMNVPTTNPAPAVDGFFVSGGGGGRGVQQDVSEEQCHPSAIKEALDKLGYIVDERLGSLLDEKGLFEPKEFFDRLRVKCERRAECFAELSRSFSIDFGFVVFKSAMVMAETFVLPELSRRQRGVKCNEELIAACEEFYGSFDKVLEVLAANFPGVEILLVSDHSTSERTFSVNLNSVLIELGYQKPASGRKGIFYMMKRIRSRLPQSLVQRAKKNKRARQAVRALTPFDAKKTLAFNVTNHQASHGIFINDEARFGGPVKGSEKEALVAKIVSDFNNHTAALEHGMVASIPEIPSGEFRNSYPDIYIDLPEGYTPSNEEDRFVSEFEWRDEPIDLRTIRVKGGRVSVKGHYPLAVAVGGSWLVEPSANRNDLRLIYDHILRRFES